MKVILKDFVKGFGEKNDIVVVKNGYGRNYLIPQGLATIATPSAIKMAEENVRQAAHKQVKLKADAQAIADKLEGLKITVPTKAGSNGKIFGSINTIQLSDALKKAGKEHELIIVPKEGHGFRKPENRFMLYKKMLEHFDSTL
jgi:large subunit ribosomal protein L9